MNGGTKKMEIKGTLKRNPPILVHSEESGANMGADAKVVSRDLVSMFYAAKSWKITTIYSFNDNIPDWYGNTWSHR
jgi:hypothetical protein